MYITSGTGGDTCTELIDKDQTFFTLMCTHNIFCHHIRSLIGSFLHSLLILSHCQRPKLFSSGWASSCTEGCYCITVKSVLCSVTEIPVLKFSIVKWVCVTNEQSLHSVLCVCVLPLRLLEVWGDTVKLSPYAPLSALLTPITTNAATLLQTTIVFFID